MLDFYDSLLVKYNPSGVLFTFFVWCVMLLISTPKVAYFAPYRNVSTKNTKLFFYLFALVCILGLHRWDTYHISNRLMGNYEHLEPVHEWIRIHLAGERELPYRFLIWGTSVAIYYWLAKKLNCCNHNFCLICVFFLVESMFPEMRGTFGHILLLLGVVLLLKSERRKAYILIGIFCITSSFFFHRSIWICHIFACLALLSFDRKTVILLSWCLFPVLATLINKYFSLVLMYFMSFDNGEMGIIEAISLYGESDFSFGTYNFVGLMTKAFIELPLYIVFFYLSFRICFDKVENDWFYRYMYRWFYICFYVGCLLSFVETSAWLSVRIKVMSLFPLPFILTRMWNKEKKATVWTKTILVWSILSNILALLMRYNNWSLGKY